tara:strand:- start:6401 stop:7444 length:1044 start_codon:yes stop_codon:yes gene_type:complete
MPELKNSFTAGKMNKDVDERIIPSNEYREALNIGIATSEDSDVGAAQNILGNVRLSCAINGAYDNSLGYRKYFNTSSHIAVIADPMTDKIYRFVHTPDSSGVWMDRIIEFDTQKPLAMPCSSFVDNVDATAQIEVANKEEAVLIDIWKVETLITSSEELCPGGDIVVTVSTNIFQLRHGMLVYNNNILESDGVYVTNVEIIGANSAKLTLNAPAVNAVSGETLTLEADRVLNFSPDRYITGINVLDGMIFWTDNYSEPKKINIERSKMGSVVVRTQGSLEYGLQNFDQHTLLIVNEINPSSCIKIGPSICDNGKAAAAVYGCTDPSFQEYNPLATINDESCRNKLEG